MELLLRYNSTSPNDDTIHTMEEHLKILKQYNEVYWGQFSNKKVNLIAEDKKIQLLNGNRRVIFVSNKDAYENREVYVGYFNEIVRVSDLQLSSPQNLSFKDSIPEYYRDEWYKDSDLKVNIWLKLTSLTRIGDWHSYLENIIVESSGEKILDCLMKSQQMNFYIENSNS